MIEGSPSDMWLHQRSKFRIIHEDPQGDTWMQMRRPIFIKRTGMISRTIFIGRWITIKRWTLLTIGRTGSGDRDRPLTRSAIGRSRRVVEELHDRGPIEPRSCIIHRGINTRSSDGICLRIWRRIDARSWPDRGAIVAKIVAMMKRKSWQN